MQRLSLAIRLRRAVLVPCLLLVGCMPTARVAPPLADIAPPPATVVGEAWISGAVDRAELDSLIAWPTADGDTWLIATAKSGNRLVVFDAETGSYLRQVGSHGDGPGQFRRPNGVAIALGHLFVTERDNHRVQVLSLPGFQPLGSFGEEQLRSPYGLWINEGTAGDIDVYVTDSFMEGTRFDVVPALDQLGERVRHFKVRQAPDGILDTRYVGAFGDTTDAAALRMVESIAGDPASGRLLIADEDRRHLSTLREYTFAGAYTGRSLPRGSFDAEAEGVALWSCSADSGYWVAVDQLAPLSRFRLFDRDSLAPRGSFTGRFVAETDGIALHPVASARFPAGALFAVHADRSVAAFDLRDIVAALHLDRACLG